MNPQCFVIAVKSLEKVVHTPESSTLHVLDPNELCRTCGKSQPLSTNPFVSIFAENSDHLLRLFVLLQIDIQSNDGLSQKMCTICFQTFEAIGKFQKNCQQIQEIFARTAKKPRDDPKGIMNFKQASIETDLRIDGSKEEIADISIDPIGKQSDIKRSHFEEKTTDIDDDIPIEYLDEELLDEEEEIFVDFVTKVENKSRETLADKGKEEEDRNINENNDDSMSSFSEKESKPVDQVQDVGVEKSFVLRHCKFCNEAFRNITAHERHCKHRNIEYCSYCFMEVPTNGELQLHIAEKHSDGKPACSICWVSFETKRMRYYHMIGNHNEGIYVCNICNRDYRSGRLLRAHNEKVHAEKINRPCPICDKICLTQKKYNYHVKTHNPDDRRYQCEVCHRKFMQRNHLTEHRTMHFEERNHLCSICGKAFKRELSYSKHIQWHHGNGNKMKKPKPKLSNDCKTSKSSKSRIPSTCDLCGNIYASPIVLRIHKLHVHAKHPRAKCEILNCRQTFASKTALDTHMRKEHNFVSDQIEKSYKFNCNKCPKKLSSVAGLNAHMKFHDETDRPYECHICKYRFKDAIYLGTHIRRVHTTVKKFECPSCDRKFIEKYELTAHMNVHSDLKSYKCSLCPKRFRHPQSLKLHMQIHTGERRYGCPICPKRFTALRSLNEHVKTHTEEQISYAEELIVNGLHEPNEMCIEEEEAE